MEKIQADVAKLNLLFPDGKAFSYIVTVERCGRQQKNEEGSAFRA